MLDKLKSAVQRIEDAEKLAPAGSHEQAQYVKAALYNEWPGIRAAVKHFTVQPMILPDQTPPYIKIK